jgi:hypothetical protein
MTDPAGVLLEFASTLIATLVGAGVALWGSHRLFERQTTADYEQSLDLALGKVIGAAGDLIDDRRRRDARGPRLIRSSIVSDPLTAAAAASLTPMTDEQLRTCLQVAELTARGSDRSAVKALVELLDVAQGPRLIATLNELRDSILGWRTSGWGPEEVSARTHAWVDSVHREIAAEEQAAREE